MYARSSRIRWHAISHFLDWQTGHVVVQTSDMKEPFQRNFTFSPLRQKVWSILSLKTQVNFLFSRLWGRGSCRTVFHVARLGHEVAKKTKPAYRGQWTKSRTKYLQWWSTWKSHFTPSHFIKQVMQRWLCIKVRPIKMWLFSTPFTQASPSPIIWRRSRKWQNLTLTKIWCWYCQSNGKEIPS